MYDILIIGAGITGTFLARTLARYELKLALVDKEPPGPTARSAIPAMIQSLAR